MVVVVKLLSFGPSPLNPRAKAALLAMLVTCQTEALKSAVQGRFLAQLPGPNLTSGVDRGKRTGGNMGQEAI